MRIPLHQTHLIPTPCLAPADQEGNDAGAIHQSTFKHQATLSMDLEIWQDIIDTLGLEEPIIKYRHELSAPGIPTVKLFRRWGIGSGSAFTVLCIVCLKIAKRRL
jgi:hypothetical protein